jgi:hypothetical protein
MRKERAWRPSSLFVELLWRGVGCGWFDACGGLAFGFLLDGAHYAEEIAAVDFFDVVGGVAFFEQGAGEGGKLVVGFESLGDAAYSVEIGADAHVVDAADLDCVVDLCDNVVERCGREGGRGFVFELVDGCGAGDRICDLLRFCETGAEGVHEGFGGVLVALGEIGAVEVDLHGATFGGECFDHVVGEIAGVAGDGAGAGV